MSKKALRNTLIILALVILVPCVALGFICRVAVDQPGTSTPTKTPTEASTSIPIKTSTVVPTRTPHPTGTDFVTPTVTPTVRATAVPKVRTHPLGATARCKDGTYSYSSTRSGTCSHHGGVSAWLGN